MSRYLRLYASFVRFAFSKSLEFRLDFYFRIVMDLIFYAVNIVFFKVLYLHTDSLAGWSEPEALVFVAMFLVVDAIHMTVFTNNIWGLSSMINDGSLDYYLTRPVSSLFFLSLRDFAVSSCVNLVFAVGILVWALLNCPQALTIGNLLLLPLLLGIGTFLHYLVAIVFVIPTFWTHSGRGFGSVYHIMTRFSERPDRLFHGGLRLVLTTIMPLSLIASVPARILLEPFDLGLILHLLVVTVALFGFVVWQWGRGLRSYSSASS